MKVAQRESRWRRAGVALSLGLATTVAIAWPVTVGAQWLGWVSLPPGPRLSKPLAREGASERYRGVISRGVMSERFRLVQPTARDSVLPLGEPLFVPSWVRTPAEAPAHIEGAVGWSTSTAVGLPWRCFASDEWAVWTVTGTGELATAEEVERPPVPSGLTARVIFENSFRIASTPRGRVELPLRPVWGGLLANTAVWGAAWWAVLWGAAAARAARERRAGHCAACGYDLRGSAGRCPECGRAA